MIEIAKDQCSELTSLLRAKVRWTHLGESNTQTNTAHVAVTFRHNNRNTGENVTRRHNIKDQCRHYMLQYYSLWNNALHGKKKLVFTCTYIIMFSNINACNTLDIMYCFDDIILTIFLNMHLKSTYTVGFIVRIYVTI